ncbi:CBS domain-containing protein [Mariniblastus fucicola]|uniref:Hypoxic response protein 1 n=1 Tax=Mariniblastus fucicola TaxID=980251 RepID=A0A5B9P1P4_9BACT|nr:CBS domain-containing protein [Mariniblastus fucicola]QEG20427.1 Hypoxic response protein 1 [Mariniblastus fucicola]
MILKELLRDNRSVYKLGEDSRIIDAVDLMRDRRIGSVVVVDSSGKISGIITDRDIALALAYGAAAANSFLAEVMTRDVFVVNEAMTLSEVTKQFRTFEVKRLPVVNGDGHPVGIVSLDDVMSLLAREMFDTCQALEPKLGHFV